MNDRPAPLHMTQSYLEMARYWTSQVDEKGELPLRASNAASVNYALHAHTYLFCYMALTAFVATRLQERWNDPTSAIRAQYPDFEDFLNGALSEVKEGLKEVCKQYGISKISESNPHLWTHFTQVVRTARHFFIHPKPGPHFDLHIELLMKHPFTFPVTVTEEILHHFYRETGTPPPAWLITNQELIPFWGENSSSLQ